MKPAGVLNVNKPNGPTSHDVVAAVRRMVPRGVKVGHAGTLDPMAEGVLPICLGSATKLFPYLLGCRKTYRALMLFGRVTDTQDVTGKLLAEAEPGAVSLDEAQCLLDRFRGKGTQVPPMYSALKVGGTRLHELARAGVEVEREERPIEVFDIRALAVEEARLLFEVTCSRGTYIRSLCHDIGALHGAGGCMQALTRTMLGPFRIEEAVTLGEAETLAREGRIQEALIGASEALAHLPALHVRPRSEARLRNGGRLAAEEFEEAGSLPAGERFRLLSPGGELIAVGKPLGGGRVAPERLFSGADH